MTQRADAMRNRDAVLQAARELLDTEGGDVALDRIARKAGVGSATLYRHFPTRSDLLAAVYAEEVGDLAAHARRLVGSPRPGDALFEWLGALVEHIASKRGLAAAATPGGGAARGSLYAEWHRTIEDALATLLRDARAAGAVRRSVRAADLTALAHGIALVAVDEAQAGRLLRDLRSGVGSGR